MADEMDELSVVMAYYGGMAEWAKHGREIAGAGAIARQWAWEIIANDRSRLNARERLSQKKLPEL